MGLLTTGQGGNDVPGLIDKSHQPIEILAGHVITNISSGADHLVCLTREGFVYTLGKLYISYLILLVFYTEYSVKKINQMTLYLRN